MCSQPEFKISIFSPVCSQLFVCMIDLVAISVSVLGLLGVIFKLN